VNKHLLPVFDKPMIYYSLTTLMLADLRDIVIVTNPEAVSQFTTLLGNGSQWGLRLSYRVQDRPGGIAEGFRVAADDLKSTNVVMILGDNFFHGAGLSDTLHTAMANNDGGTIFGYEVADPSAFGVVTLNAKGQPIALEEKPKNPTSRIAVTGLYMYSDDVVAKAQQLTHSARGELEITDLNKAYLQEGRLRMRNLGRGVAWLDGGTPEDLYEAGQFVKVVQDRTGLRVACPEEIAYRRNMINRDDLAKLMNRIPASEYHDYLQRVLTDINV
jgi:glucose-1-phosphate thymidylyltransferase